MLGEPDDLGLELLSSEPSAMVGVVTSAIPGSLPVAALGPLLIMGLTALVPPLALRPTVEPVAELGVGGSCLCLLRVRSNCVLFSHSTTSILHVLRPVTLRTVRMHTIATKRFTL